MSFVSVVEYLLKLHLSTKNKEACTGSHDVFKLNMFLSIEVIINCFLKKEFS